MQTATIPTDDVIVRHHPIVGGVAALSIIDSIVKRAALHFAQSCYREGFFIIVTYDDKCISIEEIKKALTEEFIRDFNALKTYRMRQDVISETNERILRLFGEDEYQRPKVPILMDIQNEMLRLDGSDTSSIEEVYWRWVFWSNPDTDPEACVGCMRSYSCCCNGDNEDD